MPIQLQRRTVSLAVMSMLLLAGLLAPGSAVADTGADARRCEGVVATIVGSIGPDVIEGTDGDDVIVAGPGADTIDGGRGDDTICAGHGEDVVSGGPGDDVMRGGPGLDVLSFAGARSGVLVGLGQNTALGEGQDTLSGFRDVIGSRHDDTLLGNRAGNVLDGGLGNGDDRIHGGAGDDLIYGNRGDDELRGGRGVDYIEDSNADAQGVRVDSGADLLFGGPGPDSLISADGVGGNDTLHGGDGEDVCYPDTDDELKTCEQTVLD